MNSFASCSSEVRNPCCPPIGNKQSSKLLELAICFVCVISSITSLGIGTGNGTPLTPGDWMFMVVTLIFSMVKHSPVVVTLSHGERFRLIYMSTCFALLSVVFRNFLVVPVAFGPISLAGRVMSPIFCLSYRASEPLKIRS